MLIIPLNTYSQSNKVPPFQMIQHNGKLFKAENFPVGKPMVIIYFLPECEDCHQFTAELISRMDELKKASFAMITYEARNKVIQFVSEYKLDKYSNLYIGTEGNAYFVGNYYNVGQLPFLALYNKNGDLIKIYNKGISMEDLLFQLRDL